jgi:hypothetical protein
MALLLVTASGGGHVIEHPANDLGDVESLVEELGDAPILGCRLDLLRGLHLASIRLPVGFHEGRVEVRAEVGGKPVGSQLRVQGGSPRGRARPRALESPAAGLAP